MLQSKEGKRSERQYEFGLSNLGLRNCEKCNTPAEVKSKYEDWGLLMCCKSCKEPSTWILCTLCSGGRKRLIDARQAKRHHKSYCNKSSSSKRLKHNAVVVETTTRSTAEDAAEDDEFPIFSESVNDNDEEMDLILSGGSGWMDTTVLPNLGFENDSACMRYFQFSSSRTKGRSGRLFGMQYLVTRYQLEADILNSSIPETMHIPDHQLELQMNIARLAFEQSSGNRDFLAKVLSGAYQLGCENGYHTAKVQVDGKLNSGSTTVTLPDFTSLVEQPRGPHPNGIRIPESANDIRRLTEGKHSILENLALPDVKTDIQDHAYVSVIECLRHFCAHEDSSFDGVTAASLGATHVIVQHLHQGQKAQQILSRGLSGKREGKTADRDYRLPNMPKFVIPIIFWADDCDPGSTSMQGRANVWVKTMTIVGPNSLQNTYPIAIGTKGVNHDAIEAQINEDLNKLRDQDKLEPFYFGSKNRLARCYFETLLLLADQPERRGQNYYSSGNGTYGTRFLVSANHAAIYERLKSCSACQGILMKRFAEGQWELPLTDHCSECLNWDILSSSSLTLTELPKHYPNTILWPDSRTIMQENGKWYLKTFRITYKSMKAAIECAHAGYCEKGWTTENCSTFLKTEGLNQDIITRFQEHAERAKVLKEAVGALQAILKKEQEQDPAAFERMPNPPQWERPGLELSDNIEAVMHEVFLGVVKQVMKLIQILLTRRSKNEAFLRLVQKQLAPLLEMTSDWLKLRQYKGGKFPGLISENFLAYARIAGWMYQNVDKAMPDRNIHKDAPPPEKTNHKLWSVAELKYWLRVRGLDTSGNKGELRERIETAMKEDPPLEPLPIPDVTNEDITRLITALSEMLECCMSHKITPGLIHKLDYSIRILLSAYDKIDTELRPASAKPSVISCYNFQCLMNLPKVMETFGPLPLLWEGKVQGEGYLPQVKLTYYGGMMRHSNWHYHMLKGLYRRKAFDHIASEMLKSPDPDAATHFVLKEWATKYHQHSAVGEVVDRINEIRNDKKAPVSVLIVAQQGNAVATTRLFSICGYHDLVVEIKHSDNMVPPHQKCGLDYHRFEVIGASPFSWKDDLRMMNLEPSSAAIGFGYLLPLVEVDNGKDDDTNRLFTLIAFNWKRLHNGNSLNDLL